MSKNVERLTAIAAPLLKEKDLNIE